MTWGQFRDLVYSCSAGCVATSLAQQVAGSNKIFYKKILPNSVKRFRENSDSFNILSYQRRIKTYLHYLNIAISFNVLLHFDQIFQIYYKVARNGNAGIKGFYNKNKLPPVRLDMVII